jgi:hypothetical protein
MSVYRTNVAQLSFRLLAASLLVVGSSHADDSSRKPVPQLPASSAAGAPGASSSQGSQAAAQALFDEARKAMAQGNYAAACPKFADSEKLDPGAGTLLNLANCYDKNGQSASAWATFKDAAAEARKSGHPDWEATARKRATALEATLSRLTIEVPETSVVDGLTLLRDGVAMGRTEWGVAIPVDPGSHLIEATAPNAHKWSNPVSVGPNGAIVSVTVPPLEVEKVAAPPPSPPAPIVEPPKTNTQRTIGIVLAAVGVGGIAVGSVFGAEAISKNHQALEPANCPTSTRCDQTGIGLTSDAKTFATVSTIGFAAGAGVLALGGILFFTAPSRNKSEARAPGAFRVTPAVAPGSYGVALGGQF